MTPIEARALAIRLHGSQKDAGGQPYFHHLDAVVANLGPGASEADQRVGYLHDVMEDVRIVEDGVERSISPEDLMSFGVDPDEVRSLKLLTRDTSKEQKVPPMEGETEHQRKERAYLLKIRSIIENDEPVEIRLRAMRVKLADNRHNNDPARDAHLTKPRDIAWRARMKSRYDKSIAMLTDALADLSPESPQGASEAPSM